jgi:hypothetical protein
MYDDQSSLSLKLPQTPAYASADGGPTAWKPCAQVVNGFGVGVGVGGCMGDAGRFVAAGAGVGRHHLEARGRRLRVDPRVRELLCCGSRSNCTANCIENAHSARLVYVVTGAAPYDQYKIATTGTTGTLIPRGSTPSLSGTGTTRTAGSTTSATNSPCCRPAPRARRRSPKTPR